MLTVQLLPLIIQVPLGEMLDVQQPLHDLIHGAVDERQGQVTQRGVGQTLLERAVNQRSNKSAILIAMKGPSLL